MNTEVIEQHWERLTDAMSDAARSLAVPLLGLPMGVAVGMIARPETFSPLEIRVTAIVYLTIVVGCLTVFTVSHWRHPVRFDAERTLALAQQTLTNATAVYENAVAINETTTQMLRGSRTPTDTSHENS